MHPSSASDAQKVCADFSETKQGPEGADSFCWPSFSKCIRFWTAGDLLRRRSGKPVSLDVRSCVSKSMEVPVLTL